MRSGSHHGFVGVSSSLELDGAEGIGGAELRVLADRPLLRQAVILGQTLRLVILTGRDARGQAHMLTYQAAAAAPAGDGGEAQCVVRLMWCAYRHSEPRDAATSVGE